MIYDMLRSVREGLLRRKFPVRLEYGPVFPQPEACSNGLIILERDPDSDDVAQPSRQAATRPRQVAVRVMACRATIFAQSTVAGARRNEHEHECETLLDGLHSELAVWCETERSLPLQFGGGRYARPGDINFVEKFAGVQYVLRFGIARGVYSRDYEALGAPAMAAKGTGGQVKISSDGAGPPRVVNLPTSVIG